MARKKSEFLSAYGVAFQVLKSITDAVLAEGGSDEDLRSLLSDREKCRRVAREIVERPREQKGTPYRVDVAGTSEDALPEHHHRITVTSTSAPSYADLKLAYDWVSDAWNESKYKLELHESLRELEPSTGDKVVFVKKFDRATTSEKAIAWGKENGYRLAFPAEREAFSKANPDIQRKFWIVDLGSFVVHDGLRLVPVLHGDDGGRGLDGGGWFGREWGADRCFLFVRE